MFRQETRTVELQYTYSRRNENLVHSWEIIRFLALFIKIVNLSNFIMTY